MDITVNIFDPFPASRDFSPFEDKMFREIIVFTENYSGMSPTITFDLDSLPQSSVTGQLRRTNQYVFPLRGLIGRRLTNLEIILTDATNMSIVEDVRVTYNRRRRS